MKDYFCMAIGAIGGVIAGLFGGWDAAPVSYTHLTLPTT